MGDPGLEPGTSSLSEKPGLSGRIRLFGVSRQEPRFHLCGGGRPCGYCRFSCCPDVALSGEPRGTGMVLRMRNLPQKAATWLAANVAATLVGVGITALGAFLSWQAPWYTPLIYVAAVIAAFSVGWLTRGPGPEDKSGRLQTAEEELAQARRRDYYIDHVRDTLEEVRAHRAGELEGTAPMEFCEQVLQFARGWIKDQAGVEARLAILKSDGRHYRAAAAAGFKSSDKSALRLPTSSPFEKLAREDETLTEVRLAPGSFGTLVMLSTGELTKAEQDYFRDLGALINLVAAERREGDRPEQSSTKRQ